MILMNKKQLSQTFIYSGNLIRANFLIKKSHINKNEFVLNIGVGGGIYDYLISKKTINNFSLDIDCNALLNIKKFSFTCNSLIQKIPFKGNSFDKIIIAEVLEHLSFNERQQSYLEIKRILKPNGTLVISVPHEEKLDFSTTVCPKCVHIFHAWGHLESFSKQKLRLELSQHFKVHYLKTNTFVYNKKNFLLNIIKILKGTYFQPINPSIVAVMSQKKKTII